MPLVYLLAVVQAKADPGLDPGPSLPRLTPARCRDPHMPTLHFLVVRMVLPIPTKRCATWGHSSRMRNVTARNLRRMTERIRGRSISPASWVGRADDTVLANTLQPMLAFICAPPREDL